MERDVRARGEVVPSRMKPVGMLTAMNLCILVVVYAVLTYFNIAVL